MPSTGSEGSTTGTGDAGDYYLDLEPGQTSNGNLFDLRFNPVEHWNGYSVNPSNLSEIRSSDPVLTSLSVSAGTLTPTFIGDHVNYTVPDVPYSNRTLTITATAGTGIDGPYFYDVSWKPLEDLDEMTPGHQISLAVGETTVNVSVYKGDPYRDYTLVITRSKPTVSIRALTTGPAIEGDTLQFEIMRSAGAPDFLAVRVAADELDAVPGEGHGDILPYSVEDKSPLYYIEAGDATAILEVETIGDEVWENHSKIELKIVSDDLYIIDTDSSRASVVVKDDEFVESEAVLSVSPNPIGEGIDKTIATITVTTKGDQNPHGKVTVPLTTSDGTATSGEDYTELDTTLTFAESDFTQIDLDGNTRYRAIKTADISITQDSVDEDSESFNVSMGTPSDTLLTLDSGSSNISVAITDDDVTVTPPILTALTVNTGTLTPTFSSGYLSYTVPDVGYGTHLITIIATPESSAEVSFLDSSNSVLVDLDDMTDGQQVSLKIGSTTVKVRVAKGGVTQDYTLVITRAKPTISISSLTTGLSTEGDTLSFELKRSIVVGDALAVSLAISELGVDADSDSGDLFPNSEEGVSLSYEIAMNETTVTVEVLTTGDNTWENHSKIEVKLVAGDSYTIDSEGGTASIVVKDDEFVESEAVLSVSPNPIGEGMGETIATITVTTKGSKRPHGKVTIPLTTSDGTATSGEDYTELDTTLTFAESDFTQIDLDGNTRYRAIKTADISITQDSVDEDDESFNVGMGTPSDTLVTLDSGSANISVTITDDDVTVTPPVLTGLTINPGTLTPMFSSSHLSYNVPDIGYGTHLITITATPESSAEVSFLDSSNSVLVDLDDMTDGQQVSLKIGSTTVKVRVTKGGVTQDYTLDITRAKPTISISSLTTGPGTEGDTLSFELKRSIVAGDALAVSLAISELGVDADSDSGDLFPNSEEGVSLSYEIAMNETTVTVEVLTTGDNTWENHSKIEVKLVAGDSYTIDSEGGTASIVVKDDEFVESEAVLIVSPNPIGEGMGETIATITVATKGDQRPHGKVTIPLTTSDGTATSGEDYTELDTTLTFAESDFTQIDLDDNTRYRAIKTTDISITQDSVDEDDESFNVRMGRPSDTLVTLDSGFTAISVTITDDDETVTPPVLTGLTINPGTLTPMFSSGHLSYTVPDIGYGTHLITITATPESSAEVSFLDSSNNPYDDLDDMANGHQVYLEIGKTTLTVRVVRGDSGRDYKMVITRAKPSVSIRTLIDNPATEGNLLRFEVERSEVAGDVLEVRVGMDELDVIDGQGHGDILPDAIENTSPLREIEPNQITAVFTVETADDIVWEKHSTIEMRIKPEDWYIIDTDGATATIVVQDDDFPESEAVLGVSPNPVNEGTGQATATITVTTDYDQTPHGQVSIPITTSDGSAKVGQDYVELSDSLVFAEGDFSEIQINGDTLYQASKNVGIAILQDSVDEEAETFDVMMGLPSQSIVGVDSDTRIVSVTIDDDDNSKPTVTIITLPSPASVLGRGVVTLDGTSSDSSEDTLTYIWTTTPANIGEFGDANMEDTIWTAPAPLAGVQTVNLALTVTDNGTPQEQDTATAIVTVEANQGPLAEASASSGTVLGDGMITLTGGGSDPEQGLLTYAWSGDGTFNNADAKDTIWTAPPAINREQPVTLTLTVTDELGLNDTDMVQIIMAAVNGTPSFPVAETGERNVDEGSGAGDNVGEPVEAVDEEGDSLTYVLGGMDASSFAIDGAGQIRVASSTTLDYEIKVSYAVTVSVSDGKDMHGNTDLSMDDAKGVTINVVDVEEDGKVSISPLSPQVGEVMTARVMDPDNYTPPDNLGLIPASAVESWVWERSDNSDGPWVTIANTTTASYAPVAADKGKYLRATATYTDRRGPEKTASGVSGEVAPGIPSAPTSPMAAYRRAVNGLAVSWSPPLSDGGDPVTEYLVQWRPTLAPGCHENGGWGNVSGSGNNEGSDECVTVIDQRTVTSTTYTITTLDSADLVAGTTYDVRVSAGNAVGIGGWSEVVNARVSSTDASLSSLTVEPVDISEFKAETTLYTLTVGSTVALATVFAIPADTNATVAFSPPVDFDMLRAGHQIALHPGDTIIAMTVTAEDEATTRTYTIIITQVAANSAPKVSVTPDLATVNGCNAVSLNGTSRDPENDTLFYFWTASADIGHFADESSEDTVWTAPAPGSLPQTVILTLTVTDGGGESATDSVIVTVRAH